MKQDWHGYAKKLESMERLLERSEINQGSKHHINEFRRRLVVDGISPPRILKYLSNLKTLALLNNKPFDQWTKDDAITVVEIVERKALSEWSKQSYKVVLKRFFKWLKNSDDEYPPEVRWIKTNIRADRLKLPAEGDILTEQEIQRLIQHADHPRDKALIASLYESGCRIGELATARLKDVTFEKHGCRVHVTGKTGPRPILLLSSTAYLATWINMHPQRDNREAPLWVNIGNTKRGKPLQYGNVRKLLHNLFIKAGVKKRCNPHIFRHSRASHLAPHLSEQVLCKVFGWRMASKMPAVYVHMSGKNTDDALMKLHGVATTVEERVETRAQTCPRCEHINPSDYTFCGKCGCGLDAKAVLELEQRQKELETKRTASDNVLNQLMQDAEVRELLKRKLSALNV